MVSIYIPELTRDRLKRHAVALGVSITELVNPTLTELLERLDRSAVAALKKTGKKSKTISITP